MKQCSEWITWPSAGFGFVCIIVISKKKLKNIKKLWKFIYGSNKYNKIGYVVFLTKF